MAPALGILQLCDAETCAGDEGREVVKSAAEAGQHDGVDGCVICGSDREVGPVAVPD